MNAAEFEELRVRPEGWLPLVAELAAELGVAGELVAFPDGSNLVAAVGDSWVLKVFPPFHRHQWESERRALAWLEGRAPVAVPTLVRDGAWREWTFVLLTRLAGTLLEERWPHLGRGARVRIMADIGAAMASVHAIAVGVLADLPPAWDGFLREQVAGCAARHARLDAPEWLLAELPLALQRVPRFHGRVLLTGEYTPFNVLVDEGSRLCGMVDLGDAMVGPPSYDLLGPSVFCAEGDPELVHSLFSSYGLALDASARERLVLLLLLHRYSDLAGQVRVRGWRDAGSIAALAQLIWPAPGCAPVSSA